MMEPAPFALPEPLFRVRMESRELMSGPLRRRLGGGRCGMMSFVSCRRSGKGIGEIETVERVLSLKFYIVDL